MNFEEVMQIVNTKRSNDKNNNIVWQWQQYKLKRANSNAPYHYRRNGKLYLVLKDKEGNIIHKLQKLEYNVLDNTTCPLSNKKSKNANPSQAIELNAAHLAYKEFNK